MMASVLFPIFLVSFFSSISQSRFMKWRVVFGRSVSWGVTILLRWQRRDKKMGTTLLLLLLQLLPQYYCLPPIILIASTHSCYLVITSLSLAIVYMDRGKGQAVYVFMVVSTLKGLYCVPIISLSHRAGLPTNIFACIICSRYPHISRARTSGYD